MCGNFLQVEFQFLVSPFLPCGTEEGVSPQIWSPGFVLDLEFSSAPFQNSKASISDLSSAHILGF